MGTLEYGGSRELIHVEDRALAHVKFVTLTKLRRGESFALSWKHPKCQPPGRSTIWMHPTISLRFEFEEPEAPTLNRDWLHALMESSHSTGGITLVDEVLGPGA